MFWRSDTATRSGFGSRKYQQASMKSYDFKTPGDLMEDFWVSGDAKLKEEGIDE